MGVTHFDEAPSRTFELGHIRGRWTALGTGAGAVEIGVNRLQLPAGGWSTPAHEHGAEEELFYLLAGRGISWHDGRTAELAAGDCILYRPNTGPHTVHATEPLDMLAFGPRLYEEILGFPRLERSMIGRRIVRSDPGRIEGAPAQFVYESRLGPPELPAEHGPDAALHVLDAEALHTLGPDRDAFEQRARLVVTGFADREHRVQVDVRLYQRRRHQSPAQVDDLLRLRLRGGDPPVADSDFAGFGRSRQMARRQSTARLAARPHNRYRVGKGAIACPINA